MIESVLKHKRLILGGLLVSGFILASPVEADAINREEVSRWFRELSGFRLEEVVTQEAMSSNALPSIRLDNGYSSHRFEISNVNEYVLRYTASNTSTRCVPQLDLLRANQLPLLSLYHSGEVSIRLQPGSYTLLMNTESTCSNTSYEVNIVRRDKNSSVVSPSQPPASLDISALQRTRLNTHITSTSATGRFGPKALVPNGRWITYVVPISDRKYLSINTSSSSVGISVQRRWASIRGNRVIGLDSQQGSRAITGKGELTVSLEEGSNTYTTPIYVITFTNDSAGSIELHGSITASN